MLLGKGLFGAITLNGKWSATLRKKCFNISWNIKAVHGKKIDNNRKHNEIKRSFTCKVKRHNKKHKEKKRSFTQKVDGPRQLDAVIRQQYTHTVFAPK